MFTEEEYEAFQEAQEEADYEYLSTIPTKTIIEYLMTQDTDDIVEELLAENPPSVLEVADSISRVNPRDLAYILSFVHQDTLRDLLLNLEFYKGTPYDYNT